MEEKTSQGMASDSYVVDRYSLKLKNEFILTTRATSLPPLVLPSSQQTTKETDDIDQKSKNNRSKGKKGRNQKRPRDERIDSASKICLSVLREEACPYGETCRFVHDMKVFMAERPDDIKEIDECPIFAIRGKCPYGALCRFGKSHINVETGMNVVVKKECTPPEVINVLPKEVQLQLRKKNYVFKCKRHFDRKVNDTEKQIESSPSNPSSRNLISEPKMGTGEAHCATLENGENPIGNESILVQKVPTSNNLDPLPSRTRKIIDFSNKIYVAPLTTVGNLPFRRIMKRFGADITCGEMALAQNLLEGKASEWALLKRHPEEDIFGVQIAAGFPDMFTRACELIENETSVDFVDLNLGCPLDLVCDKGSGAALMLRDKKFKECLQGITQTLSCPVTVKMRTGWDEKKPVAHILVPKIQSWELPNVNAIMIHGRSRLQRYSKEADWEYIRQTAMGQDLTLGSAIPVIGNGDILCYTDYEQKVLAKEELSTCAMLARGALIKPWLPTEIKERRNWDISATERLDILKDFVRFGLENWGTDQQGVNNCRRFLLEWLSFLHRYVPVGLLEQTQPQQMNQRPPPFMCGRSDLETLFLSNQSADWIRISEMLLGPVPEGFRFEPKHKANSYTSH